jgi:hypothetical protein
MLLTHGTKYCHQLKKPSITEVGSTEQLCRYIHLNYILYEVHAVYGLHTEACTMACLSGSVV